MGSLENQLPLKRDSLLRSSSATNRSFNSQKPIRPRFSRFFFFKKLDYLQWICTVVIFLFFVVLFQMFLPGSVDTNESRNDGFVVSRFGDLNYLKELGVLDFGDDIEFYPYKVLERFSSNGEVNESAGVKRLRFGYRKPQLAIIFADLGVDPQQLLMVTVATALQEIGYAIQVFSLEDGPVRDVWKNIGVPVIIFSVNHKASSPVDWLNFDGVLVNSFEAKGALSCFMQEPFRSVPLIWNIHDRMLATCTREYASNGRLELVNDWKKAFNRATVVVFPNQFLPMMYSTFDAGNYYVIPGTPEEAWEAIFKMASYKENAREQMGYGPDDIVIAVVGSQFLYKGMWLEHALILQALLPLFVDSPIDGHPNSNIKVMVLIGDSSGNYTAVVEAIAFTLSYPRDVLKHRVIDGDVNAALSVADVVIYGSFLEEKSFPEVLVKSMCLEKPIIAPELSAIRQYVDDRVNGYLFPKEDLKVLTQTIMQLISNGKLSPLARNVASMGKGTAKNMMVRDAIEGYATLLGYVLKFPSEVEPPKAVTEIPMLLKEKWRWHLFELFLNSQYEDRILKSTRFFIKYEEQWNNTLRVNSGSIVVPHESFIYEIWEEEKNNQMHSIKKRREDEELKDRTDQPHGTWEDVYKSAKRADRSKNDLRERDEGELERTGQPLCIYEPYFGEGTWSFLHLHSLYRGIGLSTKGRRAGTDDIDGPSRLPLLSNPYYRDALGEYGAFFAIANRIDRVHKNAWIGFQSWRATARNESLSKTAEKQLLEAIQSRRHGDALYFWVRMDRDPRNRKTQNFWSFCDAINAGNCKMAFSEALRKMYGVEHDLDSLPPMPEDGDTWSVRLSWALPTRSFLEFVMFSRMFVDALDAQMYDEQHQTGYCCLSLHKDRHCYSRLLELLVNFWAYHSARHMVYVDPETGLMQEQHKLKGRRGKMWIKWFSYTTLKSMDEDLAEEADSDRPKKRWLWPLTGEVVWQGMFEKERNLRNRQKEKRKQQSKEKLNRMRKKHHQKVIGKYVKPPPEDTESSNLTITTNPSDNL